MVRGVLERGVIGRGGENWPLEVERKEKWYVRQIVQH